MALRKQITTLLPLMFAATLTVPVHAQQQPQWTLSFKGTATCTNNGVKTTYDLSTAGTQYGAGSYNPQTHNLYGFGSVTIQVTPVATWPASAPLPWDNTLTILENVSADYGAGYMGPSPMQGSLTGSANDGLGDSIVTNASSNSIDYISSGKQLVTVFNSNLSKTLTFPTVTITANENLPSNYWIPWFGANISIALDPRSITLSRMGAKGEWMDSNGNTHGDTTYSFQSQATDAINGTYKVNNNNWQTIYADYSLYGWSTKTVNGNLAKNITTSWDPNESEDDYYHGKWEVPFGNIWYDLDNKPQGTSIPAITKNISLSVKDLGDGAKVKKTYILKVHDQLDNLRLNPSQVDTTHLRFYFAQLNGTRIFLDGPNKGTTLNGTINGGITLSGNFNGSFSAASAATFGFQLGAQINANAGIGYAMNGMDVPAGYHTIGYGMVRWVTKHYLVDHYTAAGFDTTSNQDIDSNADVDKSIDIGWTDPIPIISYDLPDKYKDVN